MSCCMLGCPPGRTVCPLAIEAKPRLSASTDRADAGPDRMVRVRRDARSADDTVAHVVAMEQAEPVDLSTSVDTATLFGAARENVIVLDGGLATQLEAQGCD